jgi:hypothetical protein
MRHTPATRRPVRAAVIPAALLISVLALSGCAAGASTQPGPATGGIAQQGGAPLTAPGDSSGVQNGAATTDTSKSASGSSGVSLVDRQVVQTGYATVVVDKPLDASSKAASITEAAGGRVDARLETAPTAGNQGSATLTLRIPASALTATLEKLKALGTVQEVSLSSTDVTMQSQDLDARIDAMSASIDRLLTLLATATDTNALITLETAISDRQGQLESMKSERRYLADQVAMSTLTLNLVSPAEAAVTQPNDFVAGLAFGWKAFVGFFSWVLVAIGFMLPWIALGGLVTVLVLVIVRVARRKPEAK